MKKEKILYVVSVLLIVVFVVFTLIDYSKYDVTYSAPFSAYILVRALEFVLPSIILLIIALIIRNKGKNENK